MKAEQQFEILSDGVEEVLPEGALLERLRQAEREARPLRVKQGFDPTAPDIHLGHTVGLRKLKQFQDLGHQVVLIVGDCTGLVGDPSGRSKTRPQLLREDIDANASTYLEQFYRVLDKNPEPPRRPVEIHRNGDWFGGMGFMEVLRLASQFTVSQLLERDDFAKRFQAEQPISLHELLYPIMQGYDSVAICADVELGATEQKFNLLVGRELQRLHDQPPQIIMTLPVLPGLDGVQRMSKSLGNYIGVTDAAANMFGKVMSLPDGAMALYWRLVSGVDRAKLAEIEEELADPDSHPMEMKKRLGMQIVTLYHGAESAARARADFEKQFSRREVPDDLEVFSARQLAPESLTIVDLVVASEIASSRSAARRLVEQGAVDLDGTRIASWDSTVDGRVEHVLRVGRKMKRYVPEGISKRAGSESKSGESQESL
jgi:tyrosyl-tRNA synthetase